MHKKFQVNSTKICDFHNDDNFSLEITFNYNAGVGDEGQKQSSKGLSPLQELEAGGNLKNL